MKILHVLEDLWFGGGMENVVFNLIEGTPQHEHYLSLPTSSPNKYSERCERNKLAIYRWDTVDGLASMVDRTGFDVIHIHWIGYGTGYINLPQFIRSRPNIIVTAHSCIPIPRGNAVGCDHVVSVSQAVAGLQRHLPCQRRVIYNGIDTDRFDGLRPERADRSLTVGRICRLDGKTPANLIRLFQSFGLPEARYWIIGYGPLRDQFVRECSDQFWLPGGVEKPERYLSQMDIVAYPVVAEAFGLSVIEAMAMRLPVVASAIGGIPEIITNHHDGILVDDDIELANWVRRLAGDPDLRERLGKAARETVLSRFSQKAMCQQYSLMYESEKPPPRRERVLGTRRVLAPSVPHTHLRLRRERHLRMR